MIILGIDPGPTSSIVYFPDIAYYFCGSSRGLFTGLRDMKCPPWLPLYIGGKALRYRAAKKNVL